MAAETPNRAGSELEMSDLAWLIYELMSPAILGAMIYELLKPEGLDRQFDERGLSTALRVVIVAIYSMSWLYHRRYKHWKSLPENKNKPNAWAIGFCFIDLFCAIFFACAFAFADHEYYPFAENRRYMLTYYPTFWFFLIAFLYFIAQTG